MADLKLFFSLVSGELYYVEEDEVKNLDSSQIPLIQKPKSDCKKCFGRFHAGKVLKKNGPVWDFSHYQLCKKCAPKCIDWEKIGNEILIESPKMKYDLEQVNKEVLETKPTEIISPS